MFVALRLQAVPAGIFEELDRKASRYKGDFILAEPKNIISLSNIERQGFPFFAGSITLKKSFNAESKNIVLDFEKEGINVVKAKINGKQIPKMMWEPFATDVSEYVNIGENVIELTLTNNLRNMQGPFHLEEGESYRVCPDAFYKEKCVWKLFCWCCTRQVACKGKRQDYDGILQWQHQCPRKYHSY